MSCKFVFLAVGNADSIIICPDNNPYILVDLPSPAKVIEWLKGFAKKTIACLYITHLHIDHFVGITRFVQFCKSLRKEGTLLKKIVLPEDTLRTIIEKLEEDKTKDPDKYWQLQAALDELEQFNKEGLVITQEGSNNQPSYLFEKLSITILHPRTYFGTTHKMTKPKGLNERSLVIRAKYGELTTLLLADLEKEGLEDLLEMYNAKPNELKAHIVKLAHHGAYPNPIDKYNELLEKINAEIAVLSVGSTNQYGHVYPELFTKLIEMVNDTSLQLRRFVCTEATRTCTKSLTERALMGKSGLGIRMPCAGDITIIGEEDGNWEMENTTAHLSVIKGLSHAACDGRAELN